jgi:hypothetical protein
MFYFDIGCFHKYQSHLSVFTSGILRQICNYIILIFRSLNGTAVPDDWIGGLGVPYKTGPGHIDDR